MKHPVSLNKRDKSSLFSADMGHLRLLYPLLAPYKKQLIIGLLCLCIVSAMVLILGWEIRPLIDQGFLDNSKISLFLVLLKLIGYVAMLSLASFGRSYLMAFIGEKVAAELRLKILSHLLTLDLGFYEFNRPGELMSRITTDITLIHTLIGSCAAIALRNLALLLGGISMMLFISPTLTLYSLAIVPIILIPLILFSKKVQNLSRQAQDALAKMGGFLEETFNGIRICQAFTHEPYDKAQFSQINEEVIMAIQKRLFFKGMLSSLVMILIFCGVILIIGIGGYNVFNDELTTGELCAFLFYTVLVAASASSFSEIIADCHQAAGASERLNELLNTTTLIKSPQKFRALPSVSHGTIALHNVQFAYPSQPEQKILENFTLSVAPGEKVAIVGPSGAGKSTVLSLLLRFYDPQSGCVYIDGVDCREARLTDLRQRLSYVSQEPVIFSKTLYENILYAQPSAGENEVWKAAEAAHLISLIKTLPQGIYTRLGHRGITLSGGQKQRLAIAQAILRQGSILLLDEATSALDAESEQMIQDSLKKLMSSRTTVMVAHRLATVLNADRIVVMNQGKIETMGTHADLISEDGLYRRLATLQFIDSSDFYKKGKRK